MMSSAQGGSESGSQLWDFASPGGTAVSTQYFPANFMIALWRL